MGLEFSRYLGFAQSLDSLCEWGRAGGTRRNWDTPIKKTLFDQVRVKVAQKVLFWCCFGGLLVAEEERVQHQKATKKTPIK